MTITYACDNYTRTWDCEFEGEVDLEEGLRGDQGTGTFYGECPKCKIEIRFSREGERV